jgi:hypothetical protein
MTRSPRERSPARGSACNPEPYERSGQAGGGLGQSERPEARELLAAICGWFTERFDTTDLQEAKALLEELS